jgi:hypothetical protein
MIDVRAATRHLLSRRLTTTGRSSFPAHGWAQQGAQSAREDGIWRGERGGARDKHRKTPESIDPYCRSAAAARDTWVRFMAS